MPCDNCTCEKGNLICPIEFDCFEVYFDAIVAFVINKKTIDVSCEEFEQQGTSEEIMRKMEEEDVVKLCPILSYTIKELRLYYF